MMADAPKYKSSDSKPTEKKGKSLFDFAKEHENDIIKYVEKLE